MCLYIYKVSYFIFFANLNEDETKPGQHKEEKLVFVFNLSAAWFRLLSDLRIAEQGARRALRAGSLIVEGGGKIIWLESRQASAALC